ncbi:DUF6869 domain-containing protein [Methyloglobulus sp.]|uniref:DUF6869 domain-containing protein n=1 Tax=Methyloglobulus sp. TaxID=2518622 RepID=UPI0032B7D3BF
MKKRHPDWIKYQSEARERRTLFIAELDEAAKKEIVDGWVKECSPEDTSAIHSEFVRQLSICMYDPNLGWEMILRIFNSTDNKLCHLRLGAWHLESWLAIHRSSVIPRVENMASSNLLFRRLLSCVYQNDLSSVEYERIKLAAIYDGYFDDLSNSNA